LINTFGLKVETIHSFKNVDYYSPTKLELKFFINGHFPMFVLKYL